jgi:hypothetical protein
MARSTGLEAVEEGGLNPRRHTPCEKSPIVRAGSMVPWDDWIVVQEGRYRYRVSQNDGNIVQMVLSEYLACHVIWP